MYTRPLLAKMQPSLTLFHSCRALLHSPFVPFIVIFCHIIETCDKNDLDLLESVIKTLHSATDSIPSSGVRKEYGLFKALYDAACSYIEARLSKTDLRFRSLADVSSSAAMQSPAHQQPVIFTPTSTLQGSQTTARMSLDEVAEWMPQSFETPDGAEVDQYGAQLGNWLHMNNQMTRALEDSYFWEDPI
jgi:amidase